ncbi:hypothetical protein MKK30_07925 [Lactococcus formosensis]|uniref:hypothetical protein n=1 Tax=Lactococcus formosensis TaxID=1281486 RepID=UPI001F05F1A5|nr:hypothetical protein [Lactococcus formosensis]MCH1723564.1 hypothetical protein [Lactococcus formosensis]
MKIVASNSLTLSNVNDGTITHTAYSWSSDGKDRFTNVYPNLNLFKNTKSQSYTSTGTAENISSNNYPLDGVIADILNKPLTITYNYAITNSSGTWSGTIRPTYGLGGTNQSVSNTNLSGTHKETVTLAGVGFNSYRIVTSGLPAGTKVTITNLKVEFGSVATPYMPSASEVTTADWPKYIGSYSDTNPSTSTEPSKYSWALFKGSDGEKGDSGDPGKVVQQDTEPSDRFKDMLWQYTGIAPLKVTGLTAQPNMTYVWNGEAWQIWFLNPANLQAVNAWITNAMIANAAIDFAKINSATIENLSAITAILGDVYAGKITNEFDYKGDDGKQYKGTTVYDSYKILMDYTIDGQGGMTLSLSPEGLIIKGNTGVTGGSYALDLTKGGLRIDAGPLGNVDLTPGGLVFSSDTKLATLPLNGVVTASVKYIKKNGVVYVTGSGNWGNFPENKSRTMGNIPAGFRPPASWGAGMNSQGGKRVMSVAVETDGNLTVTSDAAQNNVYGQFSMSYPVD